MMRPSDPSLGVVTVVSWRPSQSPVRLRRTRATSTGPTRGWASGGGPRRGHDGRVHVQPEAPRSRRRLGLLGRDFGVVLRLRVRCHQLRAFPWQLGFLWNSAGARALRTHLKRLHRGEEAGGVVEHDRRPCRAELNLHSLELTRRLADSPNIVLEQRTRGRVGKSRPSAVRRGKQLSPSPEETGRI